MAEVIRCAICEYPFITKRHDRRTCGSPVCVREHRANMRRAYNRGWARRHAADAAIRFKRWYQANREKVLARVAGRSRTTRSSGSFAVSGADSIGSKLEKSSKRSATGRTS